MSFALGFSLFMFALFFIVFSIIVLSSGGGNSLSDWFMVVLGAGVITLVMNLNLIMVPDPSRDVLTIIQPEEVIPTNNGYVLIHDSVAILVPNPDGDIDPKTLVIEKKEEYGYYFGLECDTSYDCKIVEEKQPKRNTLIQA